jgi:uncharacterized protein (TIGR02266 family)
MAMDPSGQDDARRTHRVEAAFRVRYRSIDQLVVALTHDLSRGGLFMRTARFLPVNAIVRVLLDLPDGGGEVPVICRVAYVRGEAEAATSGKPAGMGVEFLDLTPERLAQITHFVADRGYLVADSEPRRPLTVLVADDDETIRAPIVAALRGRGDLVREVGDGLEALAACLKQPPELVLSDVQMPKMDGWQLVRLLRARPSLARLPVVLLTTLVDDDARLRGYQLGVDDYIGKPVRPEELLVRVDRVVARTRPAPNGGDRRSLRGDLEHVALPSLLSFLALEQKTGELLLVGEATARIWLRGGQPVRVEIDAIPVTGLDDPALYALIGWTRGQFEFAAAEVVCADALGTTVNALLLEHARRSDEGNR